jgi:hypothetical protein
MLSMLGVFMAAPVCAASNINISDIDIGRRIYEEGLLPDGKAVQGARWDNVVVSGGQAACALCHRSSGMGNVEGDMQAPPVTGNALFGTGDKVIATMDPRSGKAFNQAHEAYTEETLARALRTGLHGDGKRMIVMMPRYELNDPEMKALLAYMRQLSANWSPGVAPTMIRFATVITPEVPAARRAVFIDMVRKIVAQKNGSTAVAGSGRSRHHMAGAAEMILGTERNWKMDIWELRGAPETWAQQLDDFYAKQPVFALVSGLGGDDWAPVDAFCDRQALPCWFPSVDLPPAITPKYSLYFNRGVVLEAEVLAGHLRGLAGKAPKRVVQLFRDDSVGRGAARALTAALAGSGISVQDRLFAGSDAAALQVSLGKLTSEDAVMFWLRPSDVALLETIPAPTGATFFSAKLGGAERAPIPLTWKATARLIYPYELPEKRMANLAYFRSWANQRRIPLIDEMMQSEVYFSFAFLTDTVTEMLDNMYRDYLIERAENMISRREGGKAEAEYISSNQGHVRTHNQLPDGTIEATPLSPEAPGLKALRQAGTAFLKREGTTAYPRLTLGPGQRFASKGGYVVHFDADGALVADTAWIVP